MLEKKYNIHSSICKQIQLESKEFRRIERRGESMKEKKQKILDFVILGVLFIFSFFIYYFNCVNEISFYNSDSAFYVLAGKEIVGGNIFLTDWYGSTNSFYLISLIYGILGKIFGFSVNLLYWVQAFVWGNLVVMLSAIILSLYSEAKMYEKVMRMFLVVSLCFCSCYFDQESKLLGGNHLDVMIIGIIYIWIVSKEIDECKNYKFGLSTASIFMCLSIISDALAILFVVLPLLLFLCISFFVSSKKRNYIVKHLLLIICLTVGSKFFSFIIQTKLKGIGSEQQASSLKFVEYDQLFDKVAFYIAEILHLFNANFFGKNFAIENIRIFICLAIFIVLLFGFIMSFSRLIKSVFNQILCCIIFVISSVMIFTGHISFEEGIVLPSRLVYLLFISLVLLFTQVDWVMIMDKLDIKKNYRPVIGVISILIILITGVSTMKVEDDSNRTELIFYKVANELCKRGLTQGYAPFWFSNSVTVASEGKVEVNPAGGPDIHKFKWLSYDTSRWDYANFIIANSQAEHWDEISRQSIMDCIGIPDEEVWIDGACVIMIYKKNIMPYVDDSGVADGTYLDYWWDLEDERKKEIQVTNLHWVSAFEADDEGYFTSTAEGQLISGPGKSLKEGNYTMTFYYEYSGDMNQGEKIGRVDAYSIEQKIEQVSKEIVVGEEKVVLNNVKVYEGCTDAQLTAYAYVDGLTIKKITIEPQ